MGSFVTWFFLKPSGYVSAISCKVPEVVNHPLGLHSNPHTSQASGTSITSPSSSLQSSKLPCSNNWAILGGSHFSPPFFSPEQKPCCFAAYKQFHGSLLGAASSVCSTREKTEIPLSQSSLRGRHFQGHSLFSNWEEPNQKASSLRSVERHFNNVSHDKVLGLFSAG